VIRAAVTEEQLKSLLRFVVRFVDEYNFDDNGGRDRNVCPSCGWDSTKDWTQEVPLGHHEGCKLREALDTIEAL
jgi:hypothetical protein